MKSKCVFFAICLLSCISAQSWASETTGLIERIDVKPANNYGFKVYLTGLPALCGNALSWAYLSEGESNYSTYVSVILAAKMAALPITVIADEVSGYCHISQITLK